MELREKLYIAEDHLAAILPQVKERFGFSELAAISTCNRFELMGVIDGSPGYASTIYEAFLDLHRSPDPAHMASDESIRAALYLHVDQDALNHIFRVAASLDSLVLGETQITGQFKDAIALASRTNIIGPTLTRLSQDALATAKKVRTQTAIGKKHVSISHAAIELAQKVFGHLSDHKFLMIGAGEMSQVAAKYVLSYKPKALFVANRTLERAETLVSDLGFGQAHTLDDLPQLLTQVDVVVSSTSAPGHVLDSAMVKRAQAARRRRPLVLLDIAMPRDIDPDCGNFDDVYLFDIDDLQQIVGANLEERRKAAHEAQELVEKSVSAFVAWQRTHAVKPALAQFRQYLEELVAKEMGRTVSREIFRDQTKQIESIKALADAIASKIAADAARTVTTPPDGYFPEQLADALRVLFPSKKDSSP
jgi:glutamyl-tRNA reductase